MHAPAGDVMAMSTGSLDMMALDKMGVFSGSQELYFPESSTELHDLLANSLGRPASFH